MTVQTINKCNKRKKNQDMVKSFENKKDILYNKLFNELNYEKQNNSWVIIRQTMQSLSYDLVLLYYSGVD